MGKFLTQVRAFVGEIEREKIRDRTMGGKRRSIERGRIPAGSVDLFGYETDRENNVRKVQPEEAAIVREIYERILAGGSILSIVGWLNGAGIGSQAVRRGIEFKDGRKPVWSTKGIRNMIRKPAYKGWTVAYREGRNKRRTNKYGTCYIKPEEEWMVLDDSGTTTPAIIDAAHWEQANDRLWANTGAYGRSLQEGREYLDAGPGVLRLLRHPDVG